MKSQISVFLKLLVRIELTPPLPALSYQDRAIPLCESSTTSITTGAFLFRVILGWESNPYISIFVPTPRQSVSRTSDILPLYYRNNTEQETRLELATPSLATMYSTIELLLHTRCLITTPDYYTKIIRFLVYHTF